jgi:hypothetical protein
MMKASWAAVAFATVLVMASLVEAQTAMSLPTAHIPIDSIMFAIRPPLPGQLSYLQAIKYIDDRMRYVDPLSGIYSNYYRYWCMFPQFVDRVETIANGAGDTNGVRLWCKYSYPQCAHSNPLGSSSVIANSITVQAIASRRTRLALEDLISIMGGHTHTSVSAIGFTSRRPF